MVTAATIRETLQAGRLIEAGTLLTMGGEELSVEEHREIDDEINRMHTEAKALLAQAEQLEKAGNIEEARRKYGAVQAVAVDFPGIDEHIKRLDEALLLARAVRHRSRRIRSAAHQAAPQKKRGPMWALVGGSVLILALVFVVVSDRQQIDQVPSEEAAPPVSDRGDGVPVVAAELVQEAAPGLEAALVAPVQPVQTTAPVVMTTPSGEPLSGPVVQTTLEPLPELDLAPVGAVVTREDPQPGTQPPDPAAGESDAADSAPSEEFFFTYSVQPGDTLGDIALRQLCWFGAWENIYEQNRELIPGPEKLPVGTILRLDRRDSRCP
jgi:hypothetical protein